MPVNKLRAYAELMRLHRPIGIMLVLWPTLWALVIAGNGRPDISITTIFLAGVIIMRSAGCIINDVADRRFDGHVKRTQGRPLVTGQVSVREAMVLFWSLIALAFILVLQLNGQTIILSCGALVLTMAYPYMKRYTYYPQFVLGAAFSWAIPMAFMAQQQRLPWVVVPLYLANLAWTVAYDTLYAMVDRDDDERIGVKSTAILFGRHDRLMIGLFQMTALILLWIAYSSVQLTPAAYLGLASAAVLFIYQQYLIRQREPAACFRAFLNNNYVGAGLFGGIVLGYI